MPQIKPEILSSLIGLVVHDLRNPAATLGANLSFVREVADDPDVPPEEVNEALGDAQQALGDLMRGLDQLSWIGRWISDNPAAPATSEDVRTVLEAARKRIRSPLVDVELPEPGKRVKGGEALERLIEVLVSNAQQHAPGKQVHVKAQYADNEVWVEVHDEGRALADDLRDAAFTLDGQMQLKGRADGRYGRVVGLFAAATLAQALGAQLEATGQDGAAVFRIGLSAA